jgi:transposase
LINWLKACRIEHVVMESTGVYWVNLYYMLEDAGFSVCLVDPRLAKRVPGRPKTDVGDSVWLRKLHTYGLLSPCFVPTQRVAEMRAYWRQRAAHVQKAAAEIQHMQKSLELMNLHLHKVLSDISGVSGMRIIEAIVQGEHDARVLAGYRHAQVRASEDEIVRAMTGHYREEHLFTLSQALQVFKFYHQLIQECDTHIQECLREMPDHEAPKPPTAQHLPVHDEPKRLSRRKNQAHFDLRAELLRVTGIDVRGIDGIDALTLQTVISEVGVDVSAFPTYKHWCSWLCSCPRHHMSAGRRKGRQKGRSATRVLVGLRIAAQSLHDSKSAMGAQYRRAQAKHGSQFAIAVMANKLARIIYHLLKNGEQYVREGQDEYERRYQERKLNSFVKQARDMGLSVVNPSTGEVLGQPVPSPAPG